MRIYISGPITGNPDFRDEFEDAAAILAERGYEYINPAKLAEVIPGAEWRKYLAIDFQIIQMADAITFLPGADQSKGSQKERLWAKGFGLQIYDIETDTFRSCDE